MNFSRIRTLLICLFAVTDLFLAAMLGYRYMRVHYLSRDTVRDTESILVRAGADIDGDSIPRRRPDAPMLQGVLSNDRALEIGRALFRAEPDANFTSPDETTLRFPGGALTFFQNGTLFFRLDDAVGLLPEEGAPEGFERLDRSTASKGDVKTFVSRISPGEGGFEILSASGTSELFYAVLRQTVSDIPVDDSCLRLICRNGTVVAAKGRWFTARYGQSRSEKLLNSANLLVRLAPELAGHRISSMQLVYALRFSLDASAATLLPVWRLTVDGAFRYYDALSASAAAMELSACQ